LSEHIREIDLTNNFHVRFYDMTTHYYGGFFHVAVLVEITFPLSANYCCEGTNYIDTLSVLGEEVRCHQKLERMGVRNDLVEAVKYELIEGFTTNLKEYFSDPAFPGRVVAFQLKKLRNGSSVTPLRFIN